MIRVDDEEIAAAFRLILMELKLLAEPSGAAGLAGALRLAPEPGVLPDRRRTVGVVLTGGNVEAALVARLLAQGPAEATTVQAVAA
ncbi:PALP domain-containing protein [Micromonospora tarensis]|uniref:hypothetical protein n=1 Tax=Micromonospora tarensis TaxID=2806100 RepID=UPI001EE4822D|nr:hypothetical protein [Micromonospora tarensis]